MQAQGEAQSHTLKALVGASHRHANVACSGDKWSVACYESGRCVVVMAHDNRDWIYAVAEGWLASG